MLETISAALVVELASGLTVLATLLHTIHKLKKDHREERELVKAAIVKDAFDADAKLAASVESRLNALRKELDNFVATFENELTHIKEKQAGEIRNLGEKIEDLRTELRVQHGQLIALVTKLIDKS